jgi:hypothetical protein
LKEKTVWVEWVKRELKDQSWTKGKVLAKSIPMAEDLYIRTWANEMDGHHILWLIKEKVPIFIIHFLTDHK